jgi:mono/diheme cytochrome c family protein
MVVKFEGLISLLFLFLLVLSSCKTDFKEPVISFENYQVADSFQIQLVASEPLIEAPVTMDFDNSGRMWVVEMRGFMPNVRGSGEDAPNGRITILEDRDQDGIADHSTVFLDGLVLPRAIAHVYGGLLYAAPPNLWFVEINNGKPGKKTLVDSLYAVGGNVEHQPNGLMMNIDNWIYNSNSNFRYQMKNGKWKKEVTSYRGQWGIAKDNWGRLYYNNNTTQLIGDYVLPNTLIRNPFLKPKAGINKIIVEEQRVFPLHPTIVNRGYDKGILDENGLLVNFTAACGPLLYRGGQFPASYNQNAFVCEPMGNLIKRNVLTFGELKTTGKQAWNDQEFIASTDVAFRPVKLLDGPDGAMYVVDMHRGVLQHRADITPYYDEQVTAKKLDTILGMGRILKVKYLYEKKKEVPDFNKASPSDLITLLKSSNGWVRDRAQQLLIYQQEKLFIPQLIDLLKNQTNPVAALHALHTLNGLDALSFDILEEAASSPDAMLGAHALVLLQNFADRTKHHRLAELANKLIARKDSVTNLYLALSLGRWATMSGEEFLPLLDQISHNYSADALFQEAVVSSSSGLEENLQAVRTKRGRKDASSLLHGMLSETIHNRESGIKNSIFVQVSPPQQGRKKGFELFRNLCATCHGFGGEGIENLAPPLKGSEYVTGPVNRLTLILLKGMEGPVHVGGKLYKLNASMPGFENNLSDQEIADIVSYLRNAFVVKPQFGPSEINAEKVKQLKSKYKDVLTEPALLKMFDEEGTM